MVMTKHLHNVQHMGRAEPVESVVSEASDVGWPLLEFFQTQQGSEGKVAQVLERRQAAVLEPGTQEAAASRLAKAALKPCMQLAAVQRTSTVGLATFWRLGAFQEPLKLKKRTVQN